MTQRRRRYVIASWEREGRHLFERRRLEYLYIFRELMSTFGTTEDVVVNVGQSVLLLQDYLDIYTSENDLIHEVAAGGQLLFGPWYLEPAPFLVSAESLVRNLLEGRNVAQELNVPLAEYLVVESRIGQLVQLLNGFSLTLIDNTSASTGDYFLPRGLQDQTRHYQLPKRHSRRSQMLSERITDTDRGRYSARLWLKQQNYAAETELLRWVEPLAAYLRLLQPADLIEPELLRHAWQSLLQNQSDAILSGFGHDDVYREVKTRMVQVDQLASQLSEKSVGYLLQQVDTSDFSSEQTGTFVTVINPAPLAQTAVVTATLEDSLADAQHIVAVDAHAVTTPVEVPDFEGHQSTAHFIATDVPGFGYKTYRLTLSEQPVGPGFKTDVSDTIENAFLSVTVDREEGTLTLFDKRTGTVFSGLNQFVDGGDAGSLQAYKEPEFDTLIRVATNTPLAVQRHTDATGQYLQFLQIFRLPQHLKSDGTGRLQLTAQFVPISIMTNLHLTPGVPRLDVSVFVTNNASDHRLQVRFPTPILSHVAYWGGQFEIVERTLTEQTMPQHGLVSAYDDEVGLTIASFGMPEAAAVLEADGVTFLLTLLRAVGTSYVDGQAVLVPDAQEHANHDYSYAIIPHHDGYIEAWQQALAFQSIPRAVIHSGPSARLLPPTLSLIEVDHPEFIISAVKMSISTEGVIIRGYSIAKEVIQVHCQINLPHGPAWQVSMDESTKIQQITGASGGPIILTVAPREIYTILVHTAYSEMT